MSLSVSVRKWIYGIAGGGLVLGLAGSALWHQASVNSSERALREIETSFRDHDGTRLAYYLNTDALAQQVADVGVDWLTANHQEAALGALIAEVPGAERDAPDSASRVAALKSALVEHGTKGMAMALSSGTADSADVAVRVTAAFANLPPLDVMLAGDHLEFVGIGEPKGSGTDRVVPLQIRDRDLSLPLTVGVAVHHQGPRWQVTGIDAFDHLLATIDNADQERLIVANRPIEGQLQDLVGISAPDIARTAHGRYRTDVRLRLRIDNHSTQTVQALDIALSTRSSDDEHAETLHVNGPIPAGQAVMAEWQFDDARRGTSRMASMLLRQDDLLVRARQVVLDSAGVTDTLAPFKSYRALKMALRRRHG